MDKVIGHILIYYISYPWWNIGHNIFTKPSHIPARLGKRLIRRWHTRQFKNQLGGL